MRVGHLDILHLVARLEVARVHAVIRSREEWRLAGQQIVPVDVAEEWMELHLSEPHPIGGFGCEEALDGVRSGLRQLLFFVFRPLDCSFQDVLED